MMEFKEKEPWKGQNKEKGKGRVKDR